ncbi:MAG: DNA primase catalytic subunit PriS [Candidatus Thermoplasmatota archaeon]|jgi:DNA primase small subunit|nr:DNA primase catalytic subunit PriS [Candidatus Thermoplasmatota archaeon]
MELFKDAVLSYRREKAMMTLKSIFKEHYLKSPPLMPEDLEKREWGFFPFRKGGMRRHVSFIDRKEVEAYFVRETPRHSYYSVAFYREPDASKMDEKQWLGAELIFDLDADHIEGAEKMKYGEQLKSVKTEVIKLLDNYVLDAFGFDEKYVELLFSGGRGYHIHVKDPRVYGMGTRERREIVDYITGSGLPVEDDSWLFPERSLGMTSFGRHMKVLTVRKMPGVRDPGWRGIIGQGIGAMLDELEKKEAKTAARYLQDLVKSRGLCDDKGNKYGKATIESTYQDLFSGESGKRGVDKLRSGTFEVFSKDRNRDFFMNLIKAESRVNAGETDQPVTTDTHRLIRVAGSLHGKTGFCVTPIDLDAIKDFDPLKNAIVLPEDDINIECVRPADIELKGHEFKITPGIHTLPMYAGAFFLASGSAILPKETFRA